MKIIVDAMGGDFAPLAPVKGALMAQEKYGVDIVLTGKTEEILKALQQCGCKELPKGMKIANATEVVEICTAHKAELEAEKGTKNDGAAEE